jgi:hypothetical protein
MVVGIEDYSGKNNNRTVNGGNNDMQEMWTGDF